MTTFTHRPALAWAAAHRILFAAFAVALAVAATILVLLLTSGRSVSTPGSVPGDLTVVEDGCAEAAPGSPC